VRKIKTTPVSLMPIKEQKGWITRPNVPGQAKKESSTKTVVPMKKVGQGMKKEGNAGKEKRSILTEPVPGPENGKSWEEKKMVGYLHEHTSARVEG